MNSVHESKTIYGIIFDPIFFNFSITVSNNLIHTTVINTLE